MDKKTLGAAIAAHRKALGMTQLELAEKMQVTDKAVSKWERDLSCPDISSLPKLAEIFSISVDELMQVRPAAREAPAQTAGIVDLILKAVPLAMGAAVGVLSALKALTPQSGLGMLGIGLFCLALRAFTAEK